MDCFRDENQIQVSLFFSFMIVALVFILKNCRYVPIHIIVKILGVDMSLALPFFHAITGCDTVSAFFGIGKETAFKIWQAMNAELTEAFLKIQLENIKKIEESHHYETIVRFITMCYGCKYADDSYCSVSIFI